MFVCHPQYAIERVDQMEQELITHGRAMLADIIANPFIFAYLASVNHWQIGEPSASMGWSGAAFSHLG